MRNLLKLSLLTAVLTFSQMTWALDKVRITSGEWSPYMSLSLEHNGLIAQIAREAFEVQGVKVQISFFPWARTQELSKSGEWDATLAFTKTKLREPFYIFSDPIYTGHYVFFHRKEWTFQWNNYSDLSKYMMASTRGFGGMGQSFLDAEESGLIHVLRNTNDIQSFMMLQSRRVQLVPSDLEVGYVLLHDIFGKKAVNEFSHNPTQIRISDYCLAISKKSKKAQEILETFNAGLAKLRKSGRYAEILKSWYAKPIYKDAMPESPETMKKNPGPVIKS